MGVEEVRIQKPEWRSTPQGPPNGGLQNADKTLIAIRITSLHMQSRIPHPRARGCSDASVFGRLFDVIDDYHLARPFDGHELQP